MKLQVLKKNRNGEMKTAWVTPETIQKLAEIKRRTGYPIYQLLDMAVDEFLKNLTIEK